MSEGQEIFFQLAIALAIGLIIGTERGWRRREAKEGERVAGLRTYGLIGLLGGSTAILADNIGPIVLAFVFVALTAVMIAAYFQRAKREQDVGVTSLVAALLTYVLGGLAVAGHESVAAAIAVIAVLLLNYKSQLHQWLGALQVQELRAGLQLLLISVVALPFLPNQGYGPWQALNPYTIWWMVVLIALISFVGYFAVKIGGTRKGILFASLFGGLASSTAITLQFSRMARQDPMMVPLLSAGALVACGTVFPRLLLIASMLNPALFSLIMPATAVMTTLVYLPALMFWRSQAKMVMPVETSLKNPLELKAALGFGMLLALIMLLGSAFQHWFGEVGILALALASGVADVDAIALSLSRMSVEDLSAKIAMAGIVLAAAVNCITKAVLAVTVGGRGIGARIGLPLLAAALGGLLIVWLTVY